MRISLPPHFTSRCFRTRCRSAALQVLALVVAAVEAGIEAAAEAPHPRVVRELRPLLPVLQALLAAGPQQQLPAVSWLPLVICAAALTMRLMLLRVSDALCSMFGFQLSRTTEAGRNKLACMMSVGIPGRDEAVCLTSACQ